MCYCCAVQLKELWLRPDGMKWRELRKGRTAKICLDGREGEEPRMTPSGSVAPSVSISSEREKEGREREGQDTGLAAGGRHVDHKFC